MQVGLQAFILVVGPHGSFHLGGLRLQRADDGLVRVCAPMIVQNGIRNRDCQGCTVNPGVVRRNETSGGIAEDVYTSLSPPMVGLNLSCYIVFLAAPRQAYKIR